MPVASAATMAMTTAPAASSRDGRSRRGRITSGSRITGQSFTPVASARHAAAARLRLAQVEPQRAEQQGQQQRIHVRGVDQLFHHQRVPPVQRRPQGRASQSAQQHQQQGDGDELAAEHEPAPRDQAERLDAVSEGERRLRDRRIEGAEPWIVDALECRSRLVREPRERIVVRRQRREGDLERRLRVRVVSVGGDCAIPQVAVEVRPRGSGWRAGRAGACRGRPPA